MNDLVDTTEMYLKAIIELEEQGITPLRARIAERLEHSGPTVSQTVARMERDGLLHVDSDRHLELTSEGRAHAMSVMRKHRLAERLLSDIIGLDWELVHEEACRWEHVMSDQVEDKLVDLLKVRDTSPYGNPIPDRDAVAGPYKPSSAVPLASISTEDEKTVTVEWIAEPLQVDANLLGQFRQTGVVPGATAVTRVSGEYVTVGVPGAEDVLDLPSDTAWHVFVSSAS